MAGRIPSLIAALALALVALPAPAHAHQGDPNVVARIDSVDPPIEGVVVEIRAGVADQLLVVNETRDAVEVLGGDGEAFLRIGRDAVQANLASADWRESAVPFGDPPDPGDAGWTTIARQGSWGWFDHRLHPEERQLSLQVRRSRTPVRLAEWTVPLRHGGRDHVVRGHVEFRPVVGTFRSRVTAKPAGVEVDALDGRVPGLFVRWTGSGTLAVRGIDGEPFARLSSSGAEVNRNSTTWRDDQALRGRSSDYSGGAAESWTSRGREPALAWLDRRLAYAPGVVPDDVLKRTEPTTMVEWDLPVEIDGKGATISGETAWHPIRPDDGGTTWAAYAAGAAGVATIVALVALARGKRRRHVER